MAREVAAAAVAEVSNEDAAYRVAERRRRSLDNLDEGTYRSRLGSYLQRRGFSWDIARSTVDRCWRELELTRDN